MKKIKIKLKDLQNFKKNNKVFIDTIEGKSEILDTYIKHGEGFHFVFDDNSEVKCHVYHKFSDDCKTWKDAQHYQVGDYICGKKIISKDNIQSQDWYDFTCDNETESYIYNGIHHHNSGKSFTQYLILRYILMYTDFKVLITVPSISLVEQLFSDFKDYTNDDWDVEKEVTKVHSKSIENPNARVVISTWQTCAKKDASYFQQFDGYMCDECFTPDTKVLTKTGYKEISKIMPGDKVINYSEVDKQFKEDAVIKVHKNLKKSEKDKVMKLTLEDGTEIKCTENHEFLTEKHGWVKAKNLTNEMDIVGNGIK